MNVPLITVVIPFYNSEKWLAATLDSVLAQTWLRIEIVLVDDGSTDQSYAVARQYSNRKDVCLLRQANAGACSARNRGLSKGQGDFVQFLDADDLLHPDKLRLQLAALAESPPICAATCRYGIFKDNVAQARFYEDQLWRNLAPVEWLVRAWSQNAAMPTVAWLASRQAVEAAGPWNEKLPKNPNDDGEFFTRLMLNCQQVVFCADARAFYRADNANGVASGRSAQAMESLLAAAVLCGEHLSRFEDSDQTRFASGRLLANVARKLYPLDPDLANRAEALAKAFLKCDVQFETDYARHAVERLLGWRRLAQLRFVRQRWLEKISIKSFEMIGGRRP